MRGRKPTIEYTGIPAKIRAALGDDIVKSPAVSAEQTAPLLQCEECRRVWLPDEGDHWRAYLSSDDEVVVYCPECAERAFDDDE